MRVSDHALEQLEQSGYTIVADFLEPALLTVAREALWAIYPRPEDYFADPAHYAAFGRSQFAGIRLFPYAHDVLNQLPVHPDLIDAAERFLHTQDLQLYKVELWAKYSGAIDYNQAHHRDYGNHSLLVPSLDGRHRQLTTFILLSDVTEADGPTKVVPLQHSRDIPLVPTTLPYGAMFDAEVSVTGSAGSLFMYRTDVLHRGSGFTAAGRSRFAILTDFQQRGWPWTGKMAWPDRANQPAWPAAMTQMTPRQRELFGFPGVADAYWNEQTLRDTQTRYPGMDMAPYRAARA